MAKALVVLDMLNDFIREEGSLCVGADGEKIVPNIAARLDDARSAGELIIYLCDRHRTDDAEFALWPPHGLLGTWGADIIEDLAPRPREFVLPKRRYSGFTGTELIVVLHERGIDEMELTGVCTNICVLYTACSARDLAYPVTVHADRVATFDQKAHEFALEQMGQILGVSVVQ
jgi:nicotinamidase-related amidase